MNSEENKRGYYDSCRFQPYVVCTSWKPDSLGRCHRCGWNPDEAERRKKTVRSDGLTRDENVVLRPMLGLTTQKGAKL